MRSCGTSPVFEQPGGGGKAATRAGSTTDIVVWIIEQYERD